MKKARKASQFNKRSSKELLYLQRTPFGVFFLCFHTKLVQLWLQTDKFSCLKTLINTINVLKHFMVHTNSLCLIQFVPSISLV